MSRRDRVDRGAPVPGRWSDAELAALEVIELTEAPEPAPREPLRWLAGESVSPQQASFVRSHEDPIGSAGLWTAIAALQGPGGGRPTSSSQRSF
jgi:hypothetical protein